MPTLIHSNPQPRAQSAQLWMAEWDPTFAADGQV